MMEMNLVDKLNDFVIENMSVEEVLMTLKDYGKEIDGFYIYGCGPMGIYLSKIIKKLDLPLKGGVDDVIESQEEYYGMKVFKLNEIIKTGKKICFVITPHRAKWRGEMQKRIREAIGTDVEFDCLTKDVFLYASRNGMKRQFLKTGVILDKLDLVVTNFCSLKCKGCSLMIPYTNAQHFACGDVKKWVSDFCKIVEYLAILEIMGGEPFLYPDLNEVMRFVASQPNIFLIMIDTNGTVLPNDEIFRTMSEIDNLIVHITDYGDVSKNKWEIMEKCREYGIQCTIRKISAWYDLGELKDYGKEKMKERAISCKTRLQCYTLYQGRLYYCPRAVKMVELGVYGEEVSEKESVKIETCDLDNIREILYDVICEDTCVLPACQYCKGTDNEIMGGVQL